VWAARSGSNNSKHILNVTNYYQWFYLIYQLLYINIPQVNDVQLVCLSPETQRCHNP
jgi:hypothetical protein